jgi:3-isopropylmalate/(R)-2-methylmalate dehydratase small subunit
LNVGVLPVQVSESFAAEIFEEIRKDPSVEIDVDLINQQVKISSTGRKESFEINAYKKDNMLNGYDDVDYLQSMKEQIADFASKTPF